MIMYYFLGSCQIFGLSLREYEARKQINACQLPDEDISSPISKTNFLTPGSEGGETISTMPQTKLKYPIQEFYPRPAKRTKFRNLLMKDGGLVGDEEVERIITRNGNRRDLNLGELNLSIGKDKRGRVEAKSLETFQGGGGKRTMEKVDMTVDLLGLDGEMDERREMKSAVSEITAVFEVEIGTKRISSSEINLDLTALVDLESPSPTITTPSIATTPSTLSLQSISTATPATSTLSTRNQLPLKEDTLLITSDPLPPSYTPVQPSLLLLEDDPIQDQTGSFEDLASLFPSFHSYNFNELSGLIFTDLKPSTSPVDSVSDDIHSPEIYSQIHDIFNPAENHIPFPKSTLQNNHRDLSLPTTNITSPCRDHSIPGTQVRDMNGTKMTESILFQGRRTRKSTPDFEKGKVVDVTRVERAFRMFSAGIGKS
jgi:hypothetical protein